MKMSLHFCDILLDKKILGNLKKLMNTKYMYVLIP